MITAARTKADTVLMTQAVLPMLPFEIFLNTYERFCPIRILMFILNNIHFALLLVVFVLLFSSSSAPKVPQKAPRIVGKMYQ